MYEQSKLGAKKIIAICLLLVSFATLFFPWITISIEVMGREYTMKELMSLSGTSWNEYRAEMQEGLMDAAEEAAEEGYTFNANKMMDIMDMFMEGEISLFQYATATSYLSDLLGEMMDAARSSGMSSSEMMALSAVETMQESMTTSAIVAWAILIIMGLSVIYAIYSLLKDKKYGCIVYACLSAVVLGVFVYITGTANDSMGSAMSGMLGGFGDIGDMLDYTGMINMDLFHLGVAPFVCVIAAVVAAILQKVGASANHAPVAPAYAPATPVYTPVAPAYTPVAPAYTPAAPVYTPAAPTYAPAAPTYAPAAPAPASVWTCTCGAVNDGANHFCYACGQVRQENNRCACGAPRNPGQVFCGVCGRRFEAAPAPAPAPTPVEETVAVCPNCGAQQEVENTFCRYCGTKMQ